MKEIELKGLNETIYYDECKNGLKVYLWVNKKVNTFYGTFDYCDCTNSTNNKLSSRQK